METMKNIFCEIGFSKDACELLSNAYLKVLQDKEAAEIFEACRKAYEQNTEFDSAAAFRRIEGLSGQLGIDKYTLDLLYLCTLAPHMKELYKEKHLSGEVFSDSLKDLKWKAAECQKVYGVLGIFVGFWTVDFFKLKRFAFGRLQFNLGYFQKDHTVGGQKVQKGDVFVDVHIPSAGPLKHEECQLSYKRAANFYKKYFQGKPVIFGCDSWLLSPNNYEILPEGSNILKFMSDYELLEPAKDPVNTDLWRIFNVEQLPQNLDELPQDTSLQRAFLKWLKNGNTIDHAFAAFVYSPTVGDNLR